MSDHIDTEASQSSRLLEKKLRELGALAEMNREIHATMNVDRLLQVLVEKAVIGVNFERGLVYLLEGDFLRCVAFLDRVKKEKASTIKDWVGFGMDETAVEVLAVREQKAFYVKDAENDSRISWKFLKITDTKEYCVVPLTGRDGVLGVITGDKFYSRKPILQEDIDTLALFAGHISLAVDNARLYEAQERFSKTLEKKVEERTRELKDANRKLSVSMIELSTLFDLSRLLYESLEPATMADHLIGMVRQLGHETCAIHLWVDGRSTVSFHCGLENDYETVGLFFPASVQKTLTEGAPVSIEGFSGILQPERLANDLKEKGLSAVLLLPLLAKRKLIAVMAIYEPDAASFKKDREEFFTTFASQAATALDNALAFTRMRDRHDDMKRQSRRLEEENVGLREKMKADMKKTFVVGASPAMNAVMDLVQKVVPTDTTVLISGETGTGKELVANAIHEMGPRKNGPLIKVNCAAIPEALLESELFGHEKGAFTGAAERRLGMFQLARNGTIFLDEIGEMPVTTQTKLLRVLQEGEVHPVGAKNAISVNVRVIAATNRDLSARVAENRFRSDLYYRLNVYPVTLPPLRDRRADIGELAEFFLEKYAYLKPEKVTIDSAAAEVMAAYPWPGNVRELENIIERLMIVSHGNVITKEDLPRELLKPAESTGQVKPLRDAVFEFKKEMVRKALAESGGKQSAAAALLGLPRSNFSRLLKQLNLR